MKPRIEVSLLREMFEYDSETGKLVWKARPRSHFASDKSWRIANAKYAGKEAGSLQTKGYRTVEITHDGSVHALRVYRIIWAMMMGEWPTGEIDHKDLNKDNNRWPNLREASRGENCRNRHVRSDSSSGVKGVYLEKSSGKFKVMIGVSGRDIYVGRFDTVDDAKTAYANAATIHHGDFARAQS